jgi:putative ABC transport system permease protein
MFSYYLDLALRSFKRNVALTVLMILAIGFGVGASMTTLTVLRMLSADPIPQASGDLYYVQLEPRKARGDQNVEPPDQVTRFDAEALLRAAKGDRQAMMTGGNAAIEPQRPGLEPFFADARFTSSDLFAMFRVPFIAGGGWTPDDDAKSAHVVVIARTLAEKLFGATDVIGKTVQIEGTPMRVVGVIDHWMPTPHFFDLNSGEYGQQEQVFVPFSTSRELKLDRNGSMDCWAEYDGDSTDLNASCVWIQYWVELDSAAKVAAYKNYLVAYSEEQKRAGRFERAPNPKLRDVMEWLDYKEVVPNDARIQTWVALGFLLVCLINTIGLLLTKFLRRSSEIGVRRALGASKRSIFTQLLVEAGMIGVVGGLLGLGLAWLGLWAVRHQPTDYAELAKLDLPMLLGTFGLAVVSSLLAGLLPAWRGCQVAPALQLKSH